MPVTPAATNIDAVIENWPTKPPIAGPTMPRTKPADQRRADLMAAATALFVERGIAATTLEDVTARAGVSKGLFYQYFHSKDDLLLALQEDFAHRLAERMRKAVLAEAAWPEKLDAAVQACFRSFQAEH